MARRAATVPLNVYLNGKLVGRFRRERSGAVDFQYDPTWLVWNNAIPVSLSLPLREDRFIGDSVIAVFDNLLPDNIAIRRRVAEKTGADGDDAYSLLAKIGRDCVGALQFLPEGLDPGPVGGIDARAVNNDEISQTIADLARNPLGIGDDDAFRISIAGAQEKTALLFWNKGWHIPHGTTATTHIFKPQIGRLPNGIDLSQSVENEHFCMTLTAALGLPTAKTQIADFGRRRVLIVERFDRQWSSDGRLLRIPQEDLCQALSVPPTRKYQSDGGPGIRDIAAILKASDSADSDRRTFFKAQIVFWLMAATDGHAKNFSIRLSPGGRFRLAPLYDILSTQPAHDAKQIRNNQFKLAMALGDNRHYVVDRIQPRHFVQTAATCGLPAGVVPELFQELIETTQAALVQARNAMSGHFPTAMANSICAGVEQRVATLKRGNEG
jgi:serine/threonine-protein kinase HipA